MAIDNTEVIDGINVFEMVKNFYMPHVRFWDYIHGHKSEGCQGHIFWEE